VSLSLFANDVDAWVDDCLGIKNCLTSLGDGGVEAYTIRNGNNFQGMCLRGDSSLPAHLNNVCQEWKQCLTDGQKEKLLALLTASSSQVVQGGSALTEVTRENRTTEEDPVNGCMDPAVEDPESWECDCLDNMISECGGVDAECFRKQMCCHQGICSNWRNTHCTYDEQNNCPSAFLQRAMLRAESNGSKTLLDDSLAEKCEG
jgi:hypothetical protein